jgi:DNA cross-link repair 1A protein
MRTNPALQRLQGRCVLVLDTTYCDPQYDFPPQRDVLKYTLGMLHTAQEQGLK